MADLDKLVKELSKLTVIEAADLAKRLEDEWGVSAAAPVAVAVAGGGDAAPAFISPFRRDRRIVRDLVDEGDFIEIFCNSSLSVCESRDVKGLYEKARAGVIPEFTGISSPYEIPEQPELIVESGNSTVEECVDEIINFLKEKEII